MPCPSFFDLDDRLSLLKKEGDPLVCLSERVDFERFRPRLKALLELASPSSKGGRPPFDPVLMFKILVLQSLYTLSDDQAEYQIRDRLTFMRFLGLSLSDRVPDAKTIWLYRERLSSGLGSLFDAFNEHLKEQGYLAMQGQIVDASVVKAPRQRLTQEEREKIKAGKEAHEIWDNPHKARQKDTHARWRVKQSRPKQAGQVGFSIPEHGYKTHISIDSAYGFIRGFAVSDAAHFEGHLLSDILTKDVTCGAVWGDTAYQTQANREYLEGNGFRSCLHHRRPRGKKMPEKLKQGNKTRSTIRARVEHVFACQKERMNLFIRTIGLERARAKLTLANLAYNMKRLVFQEKKRLATG